MWPLCSALLGSPCCSGTTYRDQSSLTQTLRGTRVRTWHWDLRFSLPGPLLTLLTSWETHSSVLILPCPGSPGQTQAPECSIVKGSQAMNRETEDSFVYSFPVRTADCLCQKSSARFLKFRPRAGNAPKSARKQRCVKCHTAK